MCFFIYCKGNHLFAIKLNENSPLKRLGSIDPIATQVSKRSNVLNANTLNILSPNGN